MASNLALVDSQGTVIISESSVGGCKNYNLLCKIFQLTHMFCHPNQEYQVHTFNEIYFSHVRTYYPGS